MNDIYQVLAFGDINLISDDIRIERNADVLLNACKDIGLTVNIGESKYMKVGCHRGMMTDELITVGSNSYDGVKNI